MRVLHDYQGLAIRLTDERLGHILEHPEMHGMEAAICETLSHPQEVIQSFSDPEARLYFRHYGRNPSRRQVAERRRQGEGRRRIRSDCYLTDKIKLEVRLWPSET